MWSKEQIPAEATVFMRIHRTWMRGGEVMIGAFQDREGGMSVDWNEYSTAEQTRLRARRPAENGVVGMIVGATRSIEGLLVEHDPIQENTLDAQGKPVSPNRAHTEILGAKTEERRVKLSRIYSWEIRLA